MTIEEIERACRLAELAGTGVMLTADELRKLLNIIYKQQKELEYYDGWARYTSRPERVE